MQSKKKNTSRRKTPWDNNKKLSPIESFIQDKYLATYDYRHPVLSRTNEDVLLNSYHLDTCRCCGSQRIRRYGFTKNNIQRYHCIECKQTFTVTTNTIFADHKISIGEWVEFCLNLFRHGSINIISKTNKNSYNTARYWLQKLFLVLRDSQDGVVLEGEVQIDETYIPVIKSDRTITEGKKLRGTSKDQYCIAIGCDGNQVYACVEGKGKPSQAKTMAAFGKHIKPRSTLIHDKEKSHRISVKKLNLLDQSYDASVIKVLPDKDNPLQAINHQCFLLQTFLRAHDGFDRESLSDFVNLFCFIQNPPHEKLEKVKILLDNALHSTKSLKYRDFFTKE